MSNPWEDHQAAVAQFSEAVAALQEHISMATEQAEVAMGIAQAAVGRSAMESASNAVGFMGAVHSYLQDAYGSSNAARAEMERYGGGF